MTTDCIAHSFAQDFENLLVRAERDGWFDQERAEKLLADSEVARGISALRGTVEIALTLAPKPMAALWFRYAELQLPTKLDVPQDVLDVLSRHPEVRCNIPTQRLAAVLGQNVSLFPAMQHA